MGGLVKVSVLFLLLSVVVCDLDIFLSPSGNDTTGNGSIEEPYQTVPKAVEVANAQEQRVNLNLLPGTYTSLDSAIFDVELTVSYYDDGTGEGVSFFCGGQSNGFITNEQNITVNGENNLEIIGCTTAVGILFPTNENLSNLLIAGVTITSPSNYGIKAENAQVRLQQLALNNPLTTPFSFTNCNVTITNSNFTNTSPDDCAVFFGDSYITIEDANFLNTCIRVDTDGPGKRYRSLDITSTAFIDSRFQTVETDIVIESSNFFSYSTTVLSASKGTLLLSNSHLNNNLGSTYGALDLEDLTNVTVSNCAFWLNTGDKGGAIYISGSPTFTVSNSTFFNNTATTNGSAIYCEFDDSYDASLSNYENVTLSDNTLLPIFECPSFVYPDGYLEDDDHVPDDGDDQPSSPGTDLTWLWIALGVAGVLVVIVILAAAILFVVKKRRDNYKEIF